MLDIFCLGTYLQKIDYLWCTTDIRKKIGKMHQNALIFVIVYLFQCQCTSCSLSQKNGTLRNSTILCSAGKVLKSLQH